MSDKPTELNRREALRLLGASTGLLLIECGGATEDKDPGGGDYDWTQHKWGYLIDTTRCIGCTACMRACRDENDVPEGSFRTWVERYRISADGTVRVEAPEGPDYTYPVVEEETSRAFFVPKLCNHCENSVCSQVCPVGATYETKEGVVLVDSEHCIGCGYCVQACPYGTRFIHPESHIADKCTLCYHRITKGLEPACVAACPTGTRVFGDLNDPASTLSQLVRELRPRVLRPELGTHPTCYYAGLDQEVI